MAATTDRLSAGFINPLLIDDAVRRALDEDLGRAGDITTLATIPDGAAGQTTPQAPQLLASRPSRASQPFAAARSQFPHPGWHDDTSHAALVHVICALEPTQALLHRPQFDSLFSAVSHPFAASPSQVPHPSSHAPMTHTPTAQRPDAWSGRQAWPQPPQCDALEEVCTHAPQSMHSSGWM